jgi:16S rRNA (guanine1207-N2)-methyltransferase
VIGWPSPSPPYFSQHRIAEIFLEGAGRALKPGGTVLIVTKGADWFAESMRRRFRAVSVAVVRGYSLVCGRQP